MQGGRAQRRNAEGWLAMLTHHRDSFWALWSLRRCSRHFPALTAELSVSATEPSMTVSILCHCLRASQRHHASRESGILPLSAI